MIRLFTSKEMRVISHSSVVLHNYTILYQNENFDTIFTLYNEKVRDKVNDLAEALPLIRRNFFI